MASLVGSDLPRKAGWMLSIAPIESNRWLRSATLAWTMPLSSRLLFQTRFKVNDYKQDIRFEGETFNNIDETLSSLHVGLSYVF